MGTHRGMLRSSRGGAYARTLCLLGLALLAWCAPAALGAGWQVALAAAICVPLVAVVARFPIVLDGESGGIEVGFDSSVLVFLLCTLDVRPALAVWGLGVIVSQATTRKRLEARIFNIGSGIVAGAGAAALLTLVRGDRTGTSAELAAVVLAATAYFAVDLLLSAVALALETGTGVLGHLERPGTWTAIACFVPIDLLGYLAAVVLRSPPWWTVSLLAVPLVTILVATRAITRGSEDARRLTVLLEAAVRVQTVHAPDLVLEGLLHDARRLTRLPGLDLRGGPPRVDELGAQVRRGKDGVWLVAPARDRARATAQADQRALDALAAVGAEALDRLQLTADMVHFARHDPLTDLPNRGILLDRVAHALHRSRRREGQVVLLFIDIDAFKSVNDRFGHAAGDTLLVEVARCLTDCTRDGDLVARLGGDEFAVLFEDVDLEEVLIICDRILSRLSIGASIGVAHTDGSESVETLLRQADLAMYEAKDRGKAQAVVYRRAIGQARLERLEIAEGLRSAIAAAELTVVYQPVVAASTGRTEAVEALVRWRLDDEDVPTDRFVRIAEETGLIVDLGELVLATVARNAAALRRVTGTSVPMCVNVSVSQLRDPTLVTAVKRALEVMAPIGLVLEITEREGIGDDEDVLDAMRVISELGVRFAIDDFGVGFSSLSYLNTVPAHVIKCDAALVAAIDSDDRARAVLRAIAVMGEALGLDVVVEGVEREAQLERVRDEVGATYVQGYLMHRPMPFDALVDLLGRESGEQPVRGLAGLGWVSADLAPEESLGSSQDRDRQMQSLS